jgi:hypothetical protein
MIVANLCTCTQNIHKDVQQSFATRIHNDCVIMIQICVHLYRIFVTVTIIVTVTVTANLSATNT